MSDPTISPGDPLDAVIAEYLQQVEAGEVPDREALMAGFPQLADRLRAFFADYDRLDRQAAELRLPADPHPTTDLDPPTGELPRVRYFGDYELLEILARGGMGVVYKARQVSLNRLVALKMILKGGLATPRDVSRFRAEAEAAANLNHPHIVSIFEVGEHEGQQYYAMQLIDGPSLRRYARDTARKEAELLAEVAHAVHHAHQRGVLHRDLKPSNILMDSAGTPFVADFGLAKRVDVERSLTEPGAVVGTPRYMAPEQAAGRKDLTVAVDVYSLGVVLYERLTGQTPFSGETMLEILRQVRETEPPRPSSITPGLERDLETICLKCLEKEPSKRFGSAAALAEDLERWLRGEPILARPVGQAERLWRWCRRNPVTAGLLLSVGVLLLALTMGAGIAASRFRDMARDEELLRGEAENRATAEMIASKEANDKAEELRKQVYFARIEAAQREWKEGRVSRAKLLLEECPSNLRNWEWRYLRRLCNTEDLSIKPGGRGWFQSVATSPDGRLIAAGDSYDTIRVWDTIRRSTVHTFRMHGSALDAFFHMPSVDIVGEPLWKVNCIRFSRDGKLLIAASDGHYYQTKTLDGRDVEKEVPGRVFIYEVTTASKLYEIPARRGHALSAAISPNGRYVALATGDSDGIPNKRKKTEGQILIWDLETRRECATLSAHAGDVRCVLFSVDGDQIISAGEDSLVKVWDAKTIYREEKPCSQLLAFKGHAAAVNDLALSPDGNLLLSASEDRTVRCFRLINGQEVCVFRGHLAAVKSVKISPDGQHAASGDEAGMIKIWNIRSGEAAHSIIGHSAGICSLVFSPDGRHLNSASQDGSVKVWDASSDQRSSLTACDPASTNRSLLSSDHRYLVQITRDKDPGRDEVHVRDRRTESELYALTQFDKLEAIALSPNNRLLAAAPRRITGGIESGLIVHPEYPLIQLWELPTGKPLIALPCKDSRMLDSFFALAFTPDSRFLISAGWDKKIIMWDVATGQELLNLLGHDAPILSVTVNPDGSRIASSGKDSTVRLWDLRTGREILTLHPRSGEFRDLKFSSDGDRLISTSASGTQEVWDAALSREIVYEKASRDLVVSLQKHVLLRSEITRQLKLRSLNNEDLRNVAIKMAEFVDEMPEDLNSASWATVRAPNRKPESYELALRQASAACQAAPNDGRYLNTLGVAQYRVGRYKEATETLARSGNLNTTRADGSKSTSLPADIAFLAMSHFKLSQPLQANQFLTQLRELQRAKPGDKESEDFLREAEELINGTTLEGRK
jgi:WD40 repeat protein